MRIIRTTVITLITLVATISASPLPFSALGIAKTVNVFAPLYPVGNGGGFAATIDGFNTTVWCVDDQNNIFPGGSGSIYTGNVVPLAAWLLGQNPLVRKGTESVWTNGGTLTPLQRYQGSAYLVEQYSGFPNGPNANNAFNSAIQDGIWALTHAGVSGGPAPNANYASAVAFISNPANAGFGFNRWAVVSGVVSNTGEISNKESRQTFLVEYEPIPEPSTYAMLGTGLLGLVVAVRRRRS